MPRSKRVISSSNFYHVMIRGNNKNYIFKNNCDKRYYLEDLRQMEEEGYLEIGAWCIMNNHVHLIVRAAMKDLARALLIVNTRYAMHYNHQKKQTGHVLQGRFKSEPIDNESYLFNCLRYVHNNPVKAQLATQAQDYLWSSMRDYLEDDKEGLIAYIYGLMGRSKEAFVDFHQGQDEDIFIDLPEEKKLKKQEIIREKIEVHLQKYQLETPHDLLSQGGGSSRFLLNLMEADYCTLKDLGQVMNLSYAQVKNLKRRIIFNR